MIDRLQTMCYLFFSPFIAPVPPSTTPSPLATEKTVPKKHLTSNALKTVEGVENLSSNPGVSLITTALMGGNAVKVLLDKLSECEWTIKDVMKGSETSKAIVGFNYEDKMVGTVELAMIKEDKIWKIDNLAMPKFDKLTLPQADEDKPKEE